MNPIFHAPASRVMPMMYQGRSPVVVFSVCTSAMNDPFADVRGMIGRTRSSVCSAFGVLQPQITNCTYEESIACPAPALHLAEAVGVVAADGVLALRPELPDDSRRVS